MTFKRNSQILPKRYHCLSSFHSLGQPDNQHTLPGQLLPTVLQPAPQGLVKLQLLAELHRVSNSCLMSLFGFITCESHEIL
jgi:hypothetical protein